MTKLALKGNPTYKVKQPFGHACDSLEGPCGKMEGNNKEIKANCCSLAVAGVWALHSKVWLTSLLFTFGVRSSTMRPRIHSLCNFFPFWVIHLSHPAVSAMVVVDEKMFLPPPPPYSRPNARPNFSSFPQPLHPPPFSASSIPLATISDLPSHLLLHIVHRSFPQAPDKSYNKLERQRKTLHWLTMSLRLVNRAFYIGELTCFRPLSCKG
jgi:hypothetical protein